MCVKDKFGMSGEPKELAKKFNLDYKTIFKIAKIKILKNMKKFYSREAQAR